MHRKLILYIATSLDGFIAGPNDDLSFLEAVQKPGEDYGYAKFIQSIDTVIVGRKTYDKVLSMGYEYPHTDKNTYIVTRYPKPSIGKLQFYNGDLKTLVHELKSQEGKYTILQTNSHICELNFVKAK